MNPAPDIATVRRQRLIGIGLMCLTVAFFACLDTTAKYLGQLMDPLEVATSHRMSDYWGRGAFDNLIGKLPEALAEDGVAVIVHLSFLSQERTARLLAANGLQARVVDLCVFEHRPDSDSRRRQIEHVERLSDAYHLKLGKEEAAVAYLLEVSAPGPVM